ncbi:MAG: ABC transporter ATP-binding protein [Clostridia bacterium]|nr:ABC transporter ATP-binding protein [Clostridia bacterium]
MKSPALSWISDVSGAKKIYILLLSLVQSVNGVTGVIYALLMRNIVDAAVSRNAAMFLYWMAAIVLLVGVQLILRALFRWLSELSRSSLENIFKTRLTDVLLHRDYLQVSALHSAEWMNRLTNDTVVVADSLTEILPGLSFLMVKLASALVMILTLEPRFASILIPAGLLMAVFNWLLRRRLKQFHKGIQEADGRLRVFLTEHIGSMLMIRSFAAEEQTAQQAGERMEAHKSARMRRNRFYNFCSTILGATTGGMHLLCLGWCGYGILKGTVTFGTLTAMSSLISQIQVPFTDLSGFLPQYYTMLASAERLMEAESFDRASAPDLTVPAVRELYRSGLSAFGLQNVSFSYYPPVERVIDLSKKNMPVAIRNLSLQIRKGEYVAFTGPSGCGKSTVLKLLMCVLQPDTGSRYFLDAEGRKGNLTAAYRRLFAYVPQGNMLMNGTIRDIIAFGKPEAAADDAQIRHALEVVSADGFVDSLEQGVDTLLGEHGAGLSEGQMQRIAIARAIFSDSPVLLLDEATSSLDAETEQRLLKNLRRLTDRTVVIVTHRPAALSICDRVFRFTAQGIIEICKISQESLGSGEFSVPVSGCDFQRR